MMKTLILTAMISLCLVHCLRADDNDPTYPKRKKMVEQQIRARGIHDNEVLNAMLKVKRHLFVPKPYWPEAYEDYPLPIGQDQTISQPYIVGYMTAILQLKGEDRVLEIGTGSGYQAAILAELAKEVYTIEIIQELAESAQQRLNALGYTNIKVKHGDGYQGWSEYAPFDAIIVTAAPSEIPPALVDQLRVGGRMIIPLGSIYQNLYFVTKTEDGIQQQKVMPVRFVPMIEGK